MSGQVLRSASDLFKVIIMHRAESHIALDRSANVSADVSDKSRVQPIG